MWHGIERDLSAGVGRIIATPMRNPGMSRFVAGGRKQKGDVPEEPGDEKICVHERKVIPQKETPLYSGLWAVYLQTKLAPIQSENIRWLAALFSTMGASATKAVRVEHVAARIHVIRGENVMLDADLAEMYGVQTKNLNLAVRRNLKRFPADFMF